MISYRFVPAIAVLFTLALVPTIIHGYTSERAGDGLTAQAVPVALGAYTSAPSGRAETWGTRRFGSHDWIERHYSSGGDDVRLTVIRSYDLKSLYHHPELAVAYGGQFGGSFRDREVRRLPVRPEIPVHVLHPAPGSSSLAAYVLLYGDEYVEHPIWFQLRTAGRLLFSRRKPMTLFFAHDLAVPQDAVLEDLPSVAVLFAAIDSFLQQATSLADTGAHSSH